MQRRAAAAYVAFFLVIAAGSYGVIATTDNPTASVTAEEAEYTLTAGEQIEVDGRTYNVTALSAEESSGGGHGGGGGVEYAGTLTWINESAVQTATWQANSTVTYGEANTTYRVLIANVSNPTSVQLRPEPPDDVNPRFVNGSQVVDVDIDDDGFVEREVPIGQYLSQVENRSNVTLANSATINGTDRDVVSLTNQSVTFEWIEPEPQEIELGQGTVVELRDTEYLVYFEDGETAYLDANSSTAYYERQNDHDAMSKRINGFWAVTLISVVSAGGMVGLAFLPRRE